MRPESSKLRMMICKRSIFMELSGILFPYFLRSFSFTDCRFDTERKYQSISIPASDTSMLSAETVYVCLLSEALAIGNAAEGINYICIQDRLLDDSDIGRLEHILLVRENISLGNLFTSLMNEYNTVLKWIDLSTQALLCKGNYQRILDLAEDVIHEPIYVMDASYKLLANSRNYTCPDPITVALEKYGYHTDENIELFRQNNSLERFSSSDDFIIDEPGPSLFPTISKCFRIGEKTELVVTLVSMNEEVSEHLLELFRIFSGFIRICFINTFNDPLERNSPKELMLSRLIYGDKDDPFFAADIARSNNFPVHGNFVLFKMKYDVRPNVLINRAVDQFRSQFPSAYVFSHNYEITMVIILPDNDMDKQIRSISDKLRPLLETQNMICGVSSVFSSLHQIRTASDNASAALGFGNYFFIHGRFINIPENIWIQFTRIPNDRIYHYDSLFDFICISWFMSEHEMLTSDSAAKLQRLIKYDETHNGFLTLILLCYLMSGKRATDTGTLLHTHRNNIVYSIRKISDLISADLDDPCTCDKLMSAFRILAVASANKATEESTLS